MAGEVVEWDEAARKFWPEMTERAAASIPAGIVADSNQRAAKERLIQQMMDKDPELDAWEAAQEIDPAQLPPTAKEAARAIAAMRTGAVYCYLAFYGEGRSARFVKVGISNHPERRFNDFSTGNPLDFLWAFVCRCEDRGAAYGVEQSLHRYLAEHSRRGEWFDVGDTDKESAAALARQWGSLLGQEFSPL